MTRRRWLEMFAGAWLVFGLLVAIARPLQVKIDPRLAFIVLGLALAWSLFAINDIRWSANRAAVIAAIFYAVVIALMMRTPIDGDEPYYLLMTESIAHDRDLDLSNQYRDLAHSATGRIDLVPQIGDVSGPHGEQYSRLEPFLSLLMVPGYLAGRLPGALATIALFGALLARSTVRLFEDEGIDDATIRAIFPLIALGPPIIFYAARIWPEVPAAFCFVEAVRGVRQRRPARWIPALAALVLLKFRFLLVAIVLLARALRGWRQIVIAVAIVAILIAIGTATTVHTWREIIPGSPLAMLRGFFGLLLDGAAGILFQAPIYAFGVLAAARWRSTPGSFRLGISSSALYLVYLAPRSEWHGGWSPPLRYIVFLMPILALGVASIWRRIDATALMIAIAWTFGVTAHGLAYPWRLFHIANGENVVGETLSTIWHSDFSGCPDSGGPLSSTCCRLSSPWHSSSAEKREIASSSKTPTSSIAAASCTRPSFR
ncbi:MAG: hypothetical protein DMF58_15545 [Acidobacteria bacterium]|nr:MAG: hypothetical protein DMF58_15545 [Acidobacteriota bacterium]